MANGSATQKQINYILALAQKAGMDRKKLLEWMEYDMADYASTGHLGICIEIEDLDDLNNEDCNVVIGALKSKIEEQS